MTLKCKSKAEVRKRKGFSTNRPLQKLNGPLRMCLGGDPGINSNRSWSQWWQTSLLNEKNQNQFTQGRTGLSQRNTSGRLLIIYNLQFMLENEFNLPMRNAKMELLKLILLPQRGEPPLLPHNQDSKCAFTFRNGLIYHREAFFLMSAKVRHLWQTLYFKPGISIFLFL